MLGVNLGLRRQIFWRTRENGSDDTFVQHAGWLCGIFETAGLDAHHAAPAGQPDFVDVGR